MTTDVGVGGSHRTSWWGEQMPDEQRTDGNAVKVRLLGSLTVERADGTPVPLTAWRSGKSLDLLRLLALDNGLPVRSATVAAALWPTAPTQRAAASLRTAVSEVRRNLGAESVVRQLDSLVLTGVWVDVVEYRRLALLVHLAAREDRCEDVLESGRAAAALYRGDFHAHDDESAWCQAERSSLRQTHGEVITETATCALHLGRFREARDLGRAAIERVPSSEQAHRTLMGAHAGLGEVAAALHVFESYRTRLAEELGADPSVQTRELHLRLLRGLDPA